MSIASPFDDDDAWNELTLVVSRSGAAEAFTWKNTEVNVEGGVTNGWDVKKSGGADGARTTDTGYEPADASVSWLLWKAEHFRVWESFVRAAKPKPGRDVKPIIMAVHPAFQLFTTVLFRLKTVAFPEFEEVDQWTASVDLVEYFVEPKPAKPEPKRGEIITIPEITIEGNARDSRRDIVGFSRDIPKPSAKVKP